jgi:hypothetical protein
VTPLVEQTWVPSTGDDDGLPRSRPDPTYPSEEIPVERVHPVSAISFSHLGGTNPPGSNAPYGVEVVDLDGGNVWMALDIGWELKGSLLGLTGPTGPTGATGPTGSTGPQGPIGARWHLRQDSPSASWVIAHDPSTRPFFIVFLDGEPDVIQLVNQHLTSPGNTVLEFDAPVIGDAYG